MNIIGIDGCKSGWFVVKVNENEWDITIMEKIQEIENFI